jgi:octaprenyl-diphosphate synthase
MSISDISKPIAKHIDDFNDFFKKSMKTNVALLDLIVRYILRQRGKRVRPMLVFLAAEICGGVSRRSFVGAAMVELLHTATLVHDDVVDQSDERRGMASITAVWKNKIAVLVGDYLLSRGLLIAVDNDEFQFLKITSTAVRRMSEGELLQMQKTRQLNIDEETYLKVISDKTASLISTCCEIGAVSATDDPAKRAALKDYGELVGNAFQIRDDVLDYISRESILGKPVGHDIRDKKITLPFIYALSQVSKKEAKQIISKVKSRNISNDEVQKIVTFVKEKGGIEYAERRAHDMIAEARAKLDIFPESVFKNALMDFASFVVERAK